MQVRESEHPTNESVRAVSLKSLITTLGVGTRFDILKIDIEGAEANVFKDPGVLNILREVPLVSIEAHDRYQASASQVVADAFSTLDFNQSRSGEYLVFTNAHLNGPRGGGHEAALHLPSGGGSHLLLVGVAIIVLLGGASWMASSIVLRRH